MERYLNEIKNYAPLSQEEETTCIKAAQSGDRKALDKIIKANLKFVVSVAKQYQNQGIELEDLIAEGNIGLLKAVDKFDVKRKLKFITYAVWWIKQAIMNSLHEHAKFIRLPLNKILNITRIHKAEKLLEQLLGRLPSDAELVDFIDQDVQLEDRGYNYTIIGLDTPHTDDDNNLNEILGSTEPFYTEDVNKEEDLLRELDEIFMDFSAREKEIAYMYFGIGHFRSYTLKEIGIDQGLTKERIRQIKQEVLKRLRDPKYAEKLREHL